MHLLDDVPPADARVVRAERDLPFLSGVRDDAPLGAPEVVVEEVLEPHAGDEQEVPAIRPALMDVRAGAIGGNLAVVPPRRAERLVELLHQVRQLEVCRGLEGIVVLHQCQGHPRHREDAAARGVVHPCEIARQLVRFQEGGDRHGLLRFLVDHDGHADAAVRMTAAGQVAPLGRRAVHEIGPVGEGAHE